MTSERVLLRFFDAGGFLIGFNGGIGGFKRVSEGRIGPIGPIEASGALGRGRNSVSIFALAIAMSVYRNTHEMHALRAK